MMLTSRPAEMQDLHAMKALLSENKRRNPHSGYHIGDLDWWVFYDPDHQPLNQKARLWYEDERLIGWSFDSSGGNEYDLMIHPDFRGSPQEAEMLTYLEQQYVDRTQSQPPKEGEERTFGLYAFDDETGRIEFLKSRGYQESDFVVCFGQDLTDDLPIPHLPEGFVFLESMHVDDVEQRASVHRDAFRPRSRMTADHYRDLMGAPGYDPTLDTVVVAPDGSFVSYAMTWKDTESKVGAFEPVGTRYTYHRRGLGRATMHEGLRRLKARGMKTATVFTSADDTGNIAFYQAAGFQIVNHLRSYTKKFE